MSFFLATFYFWVACCSRNSSAISCAAPRAATSRCTDSTNLARSCSMPACGGCCWERGWWLGFVVGGTHTCPQQLVPLTPKAQLLDPASDSASAAAARPRRASRSAMACSADASRRDRAASRSPEWYGFECGGRVRVLCSAMACSVEARRLDRAASRLPEWCEFERDVVGCLGVLVGALGPLLRIHSNNTPIAEYSSGCWGGCSAGASLRERAASLSPVVGVFECGAWDVVDGLCGGGVAVLRQSTESI